MGNVAIAFSMIPIGYEFMKSQGKRFRFRSIRI
jgi:hypothetical protein